MSQNKTPEVCPDCGSEILNNCEGTTMFKCGMIFDLPEWHQRTMGRTDSCYERQLSQQAEKIAELEKDFKWLEFNCPKIHSDDKDGYILATHYDEDISEGETLREAINKARGE